ncbi:hypothetical protein [Actinokineospora iranica]|uniref:Uncharacterized protein n=1 Tax=Actinokineospora iranica TaxID=1271860 RepID=A0A1G6RV54_9PSEU|nr:hypothetical protein [Actinokineospora iranica]SDD08560.1 hypothetical protein SAMN05216174_10749 [Actinokineospora iranica]
MDENTYVIFLLLGIALVVGDGLIIYRSGLRYLSDSYGEAQSARSMARLVSSLFVLAVLGILLLISVINFGDAPLEGVVVRLGVVLLLVAIAHGIAIKVLTRMRDRLDAENLTKQRYDHMHHDDRPRDDRPRDDRPRDDRPRDDRPADGYPARGTTARDTTARGDLATEPVGPIDAEAEARANGDGETRLSRAPGAEPGVGSRPASAYEPEIPGPQRRGTVAPEIR